MLLLAVWQKQLLGSKFFAEMESSFVEALYQLGLLTENQINEFYGEKAATNDSRWIQLPVKQGCFELHTPDMVTLGTFTVCTSLSAQGDSVGPHP